MIYLLPYLAILTSLIGLILATYTDLKARIVPNKLNYGLALCGLLIFGTQAYFAATPMPLVYSLLGLILGFMFGWIMWKIGVFAGGDVKLFMGLGALNPFTPALLKTGLLSSATLPLFPLTLFIYALVGFLPYGIFVVVYRLSKNKPFRKKLFTQMRSQVLLALHAALCTSALYALLIFLNQNTLLTIPGLILWGFLGTHKKWVTFLIVLAALGLQSTLFLQALLVTLLISVIFYTLIKLLLAMRPLLSSEVKVTDLEEGMIPAQSLIKKGTKVIPLAPLTLTTMLAYARSGNTRALQELLSPHKEIISARKARGLSEEELRLVKRLAKNGSIPKTMWIKESMPFVPTMLIGYVLCLLLGDACLLLVWGLV